MESEMAGSKLFWKCKMFVYLLICLPSMFAGMQTMSSVFTLFIPIYRCSIPAIVNDTFEVQGDQHQALINRTIPTVEGDSYEYSKCVMYKNSMNMSHTDLNIPLNTSTEQCSEWVYDRTVLEETFISQANLVCKREIARANANMIYFSGMMTGAFVSGILSDMFGRKKVLIICTLMQIGGAFGSALVTKYILFVIMRFIIGFSCIGLYTSSFVIGIELVNPSKRVAASFAIDIVWCVGLYIVCFLAYVTRTWDTILLVTASLTLLLIASVWKKKCKQAILVNEVLQFQAFAFIWLIPESPRWLRSKGRFIEANAIVQYWKNVNGVEPHVNTSSNDGNQDDVRAESFFKMFTIPKLMIRTLLVYINWFVIVMVNSGISLSVGNMDGDLFLNFFIMSSMEILAYTFCFLLLNKVGRKRLLVGTLLFCGSACILTVFTVLFLDKNLYWITLVLSNIGKLGITVSHSIIYVWSAELFPTKVRNSGLGTSTSVSFAGSMISPYISDLGKYVSGPFGNILPQLIFGSISVIAGVTSLFLPETNGKLLPETVLDAVQFGKKLEVDRERQSSIFYTNEAFSTTDKMPDEITY